MKAEFSATRFWTSICNPLSAQESFRKSDAARFPYSTRLGCGEVQSGHRGDCRSGEVFGGARHCAAPPRDALRHSALLMQRWAAPFVPSRAALRHSGPLRACSALLYSAPRRFELLGAHLCAACWPLPAPAVVGSAVIIHFFIISIVVIFDAWSSQGSLSSTPSWLALFRPTIPGHCWLNSPTGMAETQVGRPTQLGQAAGPHFPALHCSAHASVLRAGPCLPRPSPAVLSSFVSSSSS